MIGRAISHYKIVEKLGEGGMGVVYKAEDVKLKRTVALKFLPPELTRDAEAKERFVHEAQAASALDHPDICTIHEIDETEDQRLFIVMAYYEGETLRHKMDRGPLEVGEAARIAVQVARGLGAAHEAGIVHRDIKPGNIMITKRGDVKIVDFGLAKLAGQAKLTKTGSTLGTAAYMSPEQARGEEVDGRTDIWSLGVVLYEMVTGKPPFKGEHEQAIIYSILNRTPEPVGKALTGAPKELERVVGGALSKNPAERYQRMEEMTADLVILRNMLEKKARTLAAHPSGLKRGRVWIALGIVIAAAVLATFLAKTRFSKPEEKPITSIAVLPLRNLSADPEQEYFSDGMTEAIIKELSQIKALRVISMTSVIQYRDSKKTVPRIAHELGIDAVVEGSVLRADHDVRITVQLIAAHPEKHIWADDFTRTLENVLVLQSEVAQAIAREIKVAVTPIEKQRMASARLVNPEAHEAYLRGRYFAVKSEPDEWRKAIEYFHRAVALDSTYALAYAGIGEAYDRLASARVEPPHKTWPMVKSYAEKALALDPALAEGILLMADVKYSYEWDIKGAEEYYRQALKLSPNLAMAHFWYGWFLTSQGRFEQGIPELKRGVSLDPLWPRIMFAVSWAYEVAGEYDSALVYVRRIAEIDSSDSHIFVAKPGIYLREGKYGEAIEEAEKGIALGITPCYEYLAIAYALSGRPDKARESLAQFLQEKGDEYYSPISIAVIYCALGDREKVFEYLEKAYEDRDASLITPALLPPWCDFIKSDPRYNDLMRRVGVEK
jgi:serine/threonine protein kinase/tetratricopeptide (TPR) repeat protein